MGADDQAVPDESVTCEEDGAACALVLGLLAPHLLVSDLKVVVVFQSVVLVAILTRDNKRASRVR